MHVLLYGHLVMRENMHQVQVDYRQVLVQLVQRVDIKIKMVIGFINVTTNGPLVMRDNMQMVHPLQQQELVQIAKRVDISLQMVNE